jgi:hypothetical protein
MKASLPKQVRLEASQGVGGSPGAVDHSLFAVSIDIEPAVAAVGVPVQGDRLTVRAPEPLDRLPYVYSLPALAWIEHPPTLPNGGCCHPNRKIRRPSPCRPRDS